MPLSLKKNSRARGERESGARALENRTGAFGVFKLSDEKAASRKSRPGTACVREWRGGLAASEAYDVEVEQRGLHDADEEADGEAEEFYGSEMMLGDREHEVFEFL